jgi:hypothetical protein
MTWHGWIWDTRRQRWEKVCEAEGLGACSDRMGEIVKLRGTKHKYATMTGGRPPTFRPAGRSASTFAQDAAGDTTAIPSPEDL